MNKTLIPSITEINKLRSQYVAGTIIELIHMKDKWTDLKPGDRGVVQFVDDAGQIHVTWFNHSHLALIPDVDSFIIIR